MTLNVMLTSRTAVFLSGDFRLTYGRPLPPVDDLDVQKLIPVIKRNWSALVAFTGVGRTAAGLDIGDWIERQTAEIATEAPFHELPNRLKSADSWLATIPGPDRDRQLAISIVGFVNKRPFAMVISNFTDLKDRTFPVSPRLTVSEERPNEVRSFVPGGTLTGLNSELTRLKGLLRDRTAARTLAEEIAATNLLASGLSSTISKECVTGFLLASGRGEITPHAIPEGEEYLPGFVKRQAAKGGIAGFIPKRDESGAVLPLRWVGMSSTVVNERGKPWAVAPLHVFRNCDGFVPGKADPNIHTFWKVATSSNEPPAQIELRTKPRRSREGRVGTEWE